MGKSVNKYQIDVDHLYDFLTEPAEQTFLPDKYITDPTQGAPITKIRLPKRGGIEVYLKGQKYPYSGYPDRRYVQNACVVKRLAMIILKYFMSVGGIIQLIMFREKTKRFFDNLLVLAGFIIGSERIKERYFNHAVREIYRVFNIIIEREEADELKNKWKRIRDITCFIMQFDPAYGYRIQDALSELNLKKIKLTKRDLYYARKSKGYRYQGK